MNLEFGFWSKFFPRKRPQTKLVASWQPEKDQLVPCRLRGLKIKRQKNEQYWKKTLKRNMWEGRKRLRGIWIGMIWKRRIWHEIGFWTPCVSEKKICFEFIFYLKTIDSWHIVSEIIFVFHPFMQQRQIVDVIAVWKGVEADKLAI